jgi:pimeloyl-ACP methyl ester carboxylesterase
MDPFRAILLPGSVLPASLAYGDLIDALGAGTDAVAKELEVYATPQAPPGYSLDLEVAGVLREAAARSWQRFHLVGYSGGGAAALAVAAQHRGRLWSLALLEPAWAGRWDMSADEQALWLEYERLSALPADEFMRGFVSLNLKPGVEPPPPPPGSPPPWMERRPGGINALMDTFATYDLDRDALAGFERPVYFALGGLSNPDQFAAIGDRLAHVFPDFTLEVFERRHHFDPPHRIEPERLAAALTSLWRRAERG